MEKLLRPHRFNTCLLCFVYKGKRKSFLCMQSIEKHLKLLDVLLQWPKKLGETWYEQLVVI